MYQCIIREHFKEAFSQQTLVALVRAGMCEVKQTILIGWARKHCHYTDNLDKREKRKRVELEKKFAKAQLPTAEAISQQVAGELNTLLSKMRNCMKTKPLNTPNVRLILNLSHRTETLKAAI